MKQSLTYRIAIAASALCVALPIQAAQETAKKTETAKATNNSTKTKATQNNTGNSLSIKDKSFMKEAAKGGMMEVEMGRMAQQQGKSAEVKQIGSRMVADHSKANNELMAIAKKKGVNLSKEKPKMEKLDSASFDKQYIDMMVKDHEKDLADFQVEAKNGSDADVKAFADNTSKVVKKHLDMVKAAQAKMK